MNEKTEEEWRKSWLERFRISPYIDWVRTPQFKSKKEKIKAKVKCYLHGHLYEYNGYKLTLVWGKMPTYKCTRCGKVKYTFKNIIK